jgi:YD repeat-containing protein
MLFICLTLSAGIATAHSKKKATQPADGAVLDASPEVIGITFDMPMRVTLISVTDQDGVQHALTRSDNMQPVSQFDAQAPLLPVGFYTIKWRGLAEDGHAMQGAFSFEISD